MLRGETIVDDPLDFGPLRVELEGGVDVLVIGVSLSAGLAIGPRRDETNRWTVHSCRVVLILLNRPRPAPSPRAGGRGVTLFPDDSTSIPCVQCVSN